MGSTGVAGVADGCTEPAVVDSPATQALQRTRPGLLRELRAAFRGRIPWSRCSDVFTRPEEREHRHGANCGGSKRERRTMHGGRLSGMLV